MTAAAVLVLVLTLFGAWDWWADRGWDDPQDSPQDAP